MPPGSGWRASSSTTERLGPSRPGAKTGPRKSRRAGGCNRAHRCSSLKCQGAYADAGTMPELPSAQQVLTSRPAPGGGKPAANPAVVTPPVGATGTRPVEMSTGAPTVSASPTPNAPRSASPALPKAQAESLLASLKGVSLHGSPASPASETARSQPSPSKAAPKPAAGSDSAQGQVVAPPASPAKGVSPAAQAGSAAAAASATGSVDAASGAASAVESGVRDPRNDDILPGATRKLFRLRLPALR